tara:strand:+ start:1305 stop:1724 length:420 start_codon:yes stop_codon:yes gene_type:complete
MNKEGDIDEFIDVLISKKPGEKKTIQLEFDNINTNDLFDNLLYIFTQICKKKYNNDGDKVDIDKLDYKEINDITLYFASFGICLKLNIYDIENYKNYSKHIEDKNNQHELFFSNNKDLKKLLYKIYIKNSVLIIQFDFL